MKRRLRAVWMILAVTFIMTLFSHVRIQQITNDVCTGLVRMRETACQGNYEGASQQMDELLAYYDAQQHFLEFFIKRETVLSTCVNLHGLKAYIRADSLPDLCSETDKALEQARTLEHLFTAIV